MIPNIGPMEIGIVLLIALLVFGPKKLPSLGRSLGQGLNEFRSGLSSSEAKETDEEPEAKPAATAQIGASARGG